MLYTHSLNSVILFKYWRKNFYMFDNKKRILVVSPHADDGEIGCGGTINKLITRGDNVYYVAFSIAEEAIPSQYPKDVSSKNVMEATDILGIDNNNVIVYKFKVRLFSDSRQQILNSLINLKNDINPDIVFVPSIHDTHQDHIVIANECFRAFKTTTIFGYEISWNTTNFNTQLFISLSEENVNVKVNALRVYKSQQHRLYMDESFIRGLVKVRGVQAGCDYAEAFEVVRCIVN